MEKIEHIQTEKHRDATNLYISVMKYFTIPFFASTIVTLIIIFFRIREQERFTLFKLSLTGSLIAIPLLIFGINLIVYLLPLFPIKKRIKKNIFKKSYDLILEPDLTIEEQKKPTKAKYKVRKAVLVALYTIGSIILLLNLILFLIDYFV